MSIKWRTLRRELELGRGQFALNECIAIANTEAKLSEKRSHKGTSGQIYSIINSSSYVRVTSQMQSQLMSSKKQGLAPERIRAGRYKKDVVNWNRIAADSKQWLSSVEC